jgi:hypothetical protein
MAAVAPGNPRTWDRRLIKVAGVATFCEKIIANSP